MNNFKINNEQFKQININNDLMLQISRTECGYIFDFYAAKDNNKLFDSIVIFDDDINDED